MINSSIGDVDIAVGGNERSRADIVRIGCAADELGVGNLWIAEGVGRDAFSILTELATVTAQIGLGTGIVNVFSRTPTALAQAAASLLEIMGTRTLNLGLGTSGKALMEKYHGIRYERPVTRLRETVGTIDEVFRTGVLPSGGEVFALDRMALGVAVDRERLNLYVAGLSDRTLELAGAHADGWLPIWPSVNGIGEPLQVVEQSATATGRPRPAVAGYIYGVVGSSPRLVEHLRATLAWYVAANGTAYRRLFERYGYGDVADRICELWSAGDRELARRAITDELLAECTLIGEPDQVLEQVNTFRAAGIDRPVLRLPQQIATSECVDMLSTLAEKCSGPSARASAT